VLPADTAASTRWRLGAFSAVTQPCNWLSIKTPRCDLA